ncbi:MAG: hypothetical protein IIV90_04720 [Oscillospiraceae bacterium]|nr:hypothetical protein [Oscillospiraceae bacterium]
MAGCGDVSQKNNWIVQAVFEETGNETVRVKLLCRTAESEEGEYKLFSARGEEEEDALKELKRQESGSFYFGHCELLFLKKETAAEQAEDAAEFWQEPERGCGNMAVYLINMGEEEKEGQDWKSFFAQLERLHKEQPVTAWAHSMAGEEDSFLIPQLLWEEDGLKSDGTVFFWEDGKEKWGEGRASLAGVLLGQKDRLDWQSEDGEEIFLEPVVVSYPFTEVEAGKEAVVLDAFDKGKAGKEAAQKLKEKLEEELEQMVQETARPGKDIFGFARRCVAAEKLRCRVNIWS